MRGAEPDGGQTGIVHGVVEDDQHMSVEIDRPGLICPFPGETGSALC